MAKFNKIILVFYIEVGNLDPRDVTSFIEKSKSSMGMSNEDKKQMLQYFIPVREGGTRVECLNPPSACCCKNSGFDNKVEEVNNKLDRMLELMFPITREVIIEKAWDYIG